MGFCTLTGFACIRCAGFKPFRPPALAHQAPPAIILAALRRFRGAALFRGLRTSSRLGAPFRPLGLTVRRSRPPTAAAELRALAFHKSRRRSSNGSIQKWQSVNTISRCSIRRPAFTRNCCSASRNLSVHRVRRRNCNCGRSHFATTKP